MNSDRTNRYNNKTLSIGTESIYSDTSPINRNHQNGGGFFDKLPDIIKNNLPSFGSNEPTKTENNIMKYFNQKKPESAYALLSNELDNEEKINFSLQDEKDKNTVLHYLVIHSYTYNDLRKLFSRIINSENKLVTNDILNIKNNNGKDVAQQAVLCGEQDEARKMFYQEMVSEMHVYGNYESNDKQNGVVFCEDTDMFEDTDVEPVQHEAPVVVPIEAPVVEPVQHKAPVAGDMKNIFLKQGQGEEIKKIVDGYVPHTQPFTDLSESMSMLDMESTERPVETVEEEGSVFETIKTTNSAPKNIALGGQVTTEMDSVDVLNMIMDQFRNTNTNKQMGGGSKKKIGGTRSMITYSEISVGGNSSEDMSFDSSDVKQISEMARALDKSTDKHKEAVERIKELLKLDDVHAKAYKALLYAEIKKDLPESSNFAKAEELEKRTQEKNLKSNFKKMDKKKEKEYKDMVKLIKEKEEERKKRDSEKEEKNKKEVKRHSKKMERSKSDDSITDSSNITMSFNTDDSFTDSSDYSV
jgi:hypothetical protein